MNFHYRQCKLNYVFLKIPTLLVIQNHVREPFITLENFGLSQSFLARQLSENEVQKPEFPFYRVDAIFFTIKGEVFCTGETKILDGIL